MTDCFFCELIESKANLIFEDERLSVMFSPEPAVPGHIVVVPKQHFPILETVPDFIVSEMFKAANKASIILFDGIGAQGTNIIIQNGPPAGQKHTHISINILPRFENDVLKIGWAPKQASEEELSKIESQLKDETKNVGLFEKEEQKPIEIEKVEEVPEEDYRVKGLERIP